jgi:hypothetical protein
VAQIRARIADLQAMERVIADDVERRAGGEEPRCLMTNHRGALTPEPAQGYAPPYYLYLLASSGPHETRHSGARQRARPPGYASDGPSVSSPGACMPASDTLTSMPMRTLAAPCS